MVSLTSLKIKHWESGNLKDIYIDTFAETTDTTKDLPQSILFKNLIPVDYKDII